MTRERTIVSLSGGMDSATLLYYAKRHFDVVLAVGFKYGSKHNEYEQLAAETVAARAGVPYTLIDLTDALAPHLTSNLMKGGGDIPEGHYEEESMSATVVPGRNIIFASILAGVAWSNKASSVLLGVHSGDHAIYPDCRPEFITAMDVAIRYGTDERVNLRAPFLAMNKTSIIDHGLGLSVPYALTRTCYKNQLLSCGKCGACCERLEAFEANGVIDPIPYE